tara:strand:- start:1118 stop:1924 length:807 start_codon:yes stop_codon:yes gene_type:complete
MILIDDLNNWRWIELCGKDASDFLKRLTTAEPNNLKEKIAHPTAALNSQGKFLFFFYLQKIKTDSFLIYIEETKSQTLQQLLEWFDLYHFGEDISWNKKDDALYWIIGDDILKDQILTFLEPSFLDKKISITNQKIDLPIQKRESLEIQRINKLFPRAGHEISPQWNPIEVGLSSILKSKQGCYPGQEVLEKIISRGSPAKKLIRFEISGLTKTPLNFDETKIGQITTVQKQGNLYTGLAIVSKIYATVGQTFTCQNKEGRITHVKEI